MDDKIVVVDEGSIENVNWAMIFVLDYKNAKFGTEYVLEDGQVTEIHEKKKIIKGVRDGKNNRHDSD